MLDALPTGRGWCSPCPDAMSSRGKNRPGGLLGGLILGSRFILRRQENCKDLFLGLSIPKKDIVHGREGSKLVNLPRLRWSARRGFRIRPRDLVALSLEVPKGVDGLGLADPVLKIHAN